MSDRDGPLDALAGETVLVTGGAGFIGSHLVRRLAPVADVRVLDDLSTGTPDAVPEGVDLQVGDVTDRSQVEAAMADVDVVFHEAAQVSVDRSVAAPTKTHAANATGTLSVLEGARQHDARVVVASSAAVYGQPETVPVGERHRTAPRSPYGVAKLAADRYASVYADLYGLHAVSLRYFNVYGPGQSGEYAGVIDTFLSQARRGEPLTIEGDGDQTRDFVHVDDVVRANLLAATAEAGGRAINVGTGQRVTILELAERIRSVTGSESTIEHLPPREGDVRHSCADVSTARSVLGFEPRVSLSAGLRSLVEERGTDGSGPRRTDPAGGD